MITQLWNTAFYEPLYNALVFFISLTPGGSLAFGVIVLTILVKLILAPLSHRSIVGQLKQKELQPKINEIKKQYPNQQEQAKRIFELYKTHKANPFSGCLIILIQLPVILALYQVFLKGIEINKDLVYSFVSFPETINPMFLGFIDLHEKNILLAVIAGVLQFVQMYYSPTMRSVKSDAPLTKQEEIGQKLQTNMKYTMPVMVGFFAAVVPAAVALYWAVNTITMIAQELIVWRKWNAPRDTYEKRGNS